MIVLKNFPCCQEYTIPQIPVLGLLLFLVYINEMTNQVSDGSYTVLFTDNIALYRIITLHDDHVYLQSDINSLSDWVCYITRSCI